MLSTSKTKLFYHYDASGNKIAQTKESSDNSDYKTTEYFGNFIYTDGQLSTIITEEGRLVSNTDGSYRYEYNLKDHLGNVRATFAGTSFGADLIQTTSYYPFGLVMAQQNFTADIDNYAKNPYLYNDKEMQDEGFDGVELGWLDFHARMYDPATVRTTTQDPHTESYYNFSSYSFLANNPISNIDPTGKDVWSTSDPDEIDRFLDQYESNGSISVGGAGWTHLTDDEFLNSGDLSYSDETQKFYYTGTFVDESGFNIYSRELEKFTDALVFMNNASLADFSNASAGAGLALMKDMYYSKKYGMWMGKNFKAYSLTWGGNGYTGGKLKFGKAASDGFKFAGWALGVYSFYSIRSEFRNGNMSRGMMFYQQASNAASTFGGLEGAAWGIGTSLGKTISQTQNWQELKFNIHYSQLEKSIGPPCEANEMTWANFYKKFQ